MNPSEMAANNLKRVRKLPRLICAALSLALLLGFMVPAACASKQSSTADSVVTLEQYELELDRLSSTISKMDDHLNGIDAILDSLPSKWIVTTGSTQFEVSSEWVSGSLKNLESAANQKEKKKDREELASQIKEMRSEAENLAGAAQISDESGARAKLNSILSAREFQGMKSGETWLGRMWDQVKRWVSWVLEKTIGRLLESEPARKVVLWLLIGGVFLIIAVWVVRILTRMSRTEALRVDGAFPRGRNWREWAQEALAAARAADYRTALHAAYWAGVYRLADSGAWKLDRARTPREYLRLLKNPPGRQANLSSAEPAAEAGRVSALAALTRSMESSWYGYNPATQQDFDSAVDQLETLGCKLRSTAQTANS
jgi:hypothetical protein